MNIINFETVHWTYFVVSADVSLPHPWSFVKANGQGAELAPSRCGDPHVTAPVSWFSVPCSMCVIGGA